MVTLAKDAVRFQPRIIKQNVPFHVCLQISRWAIVLSKRTCLCKPGCFMLLFSCAGDPGIHFEYEYSLRTWYYEYQAGFVYL